VPGSPVIARVNIRTGTGGVLGHVTRRVKYQTNPINPCEHNETRKSSSRTNPITAMLSRVSRALLALAYLARAHAAPPYTRDVAPILYKRCAGCHRSGEVGPFPLLTY